MEERLINFARPDEIVKELFHDNSEILNEFSGQFSKELLEFAEFFSEAYKSHLELDWRFRSKSATHSDPNRPLIPKQIGQAFRSKSATPLKGEVTLDN
jgi:hypothetical protein